MEVANLSGPCCSVMGLFPKIITGSWLFMITNMEKKCFKLCSHILPVLCVSYRRSLSKDANDFFDAETGVLEAPMVVQIAGQVCILLHTAYSSSHLL